MPTTAEDRSLIHTPLFHVAAMSNIGWAMRTGGAIAALERFRTETFRADVRALGATFMVMMGTVATFLAKRPRDEDEANTPLRLALLAPSSAESEALRRRVGLDCCSVFNMSETSTPIITPINPDVPGACGRPRAGIESRAAPGGPCRGRLGPGGRGHPGQARDAGRLSGAFGGRVGPAPAT